jgi:hypothetical protein
MSGPGNLTTSGTSSFNPAATEIITAAYQILGVINDEETPSSGQMRVGINTLNSMMKELEATGIHVWTEEEGIVFLQQSQRRYLLGGDTPDHACDANSWTLTTLASSANAGATVLQVASISGVGVGDNVGVVLSSGLAFWTTVKSAPAAGMIALNAPLSGAASAGAFVFSYPVASQLLRPLRVPFSRRLQIVAPNAGQTVQAPDWGGIITPLVPPSSRQDFFNLPQPNNPGLVTQTFYNPARDQGEYWVWNVSQNANYAMRFTYYRPIQDFNTVDDTADLPQEWNNALNWNLARELGPRYSVPAVRWDRVVQQAALKLELVAGWDREPESVYFGRNSSQTRG